MKPIIIGTGWCAQYEGHNNKARASVCNDPEFIDFWQLYLWKQCRDIEIIRYVSNCDRVPNDNYNYIFAQKQARELPYRHDWAASAGMGALYAAFNRSDYLYVEQDCLVIGLKEIIELARAQDKVMYGYGEYSLYAGWAENSLMYVPYDLCAEFAFMMNEIKDTPEKDKIEIQFHEMMKYNFNAWPFGYGRKRPIDWTKPVYYFQQPTDEELGIYKQVFAERYQ